MRKLYHSCLSTLLSFSLLLQVVWIPGAFAREIRDVNERITPEQEAASLLQSEQGVKLWLEIQEQAQKISGKSSEEARIRYFLEQESKKENAYVRSIARDYTNEKDWSLKSYLQIFYTNEDNRPRALGIPGMWGLFDNNVNFLTFAIEPVQKAITETTALAQKITAFLSNSSFSEEDRNIIANVYMLIVYSPMLEVISLFSDDPKSLDARIAASKQIEIKLPFSLYKKYEEHYASTGIIGKTNNRYNSSVTLNYNPRTLLTKLATAHLEIPSTHFYVTAARLQTLQDMIIRNDFYKIVTADQTPISIPNSCRNAIGVSFPSEIIPEKVTEEEKKDKMNQLLSESGLILYNATAEGNILYSTYEEYYRDYVSSSLTRVESGFSGLLPYEDYFSARTALKLKSYNYNFWEGIVKEVADSVHMIGGDHLTDKYYREPQINDVEHFTEVLNGKSAQIEGYIKKEARVKEKDLAVYDKIIQQASDETAPNSMAMLAARDAKELYIFLQEGIVQIEDLWKQLISFNVENYTLVDEELGDFTIPMSGMNQYLAAKMIQQEVGAPDFLLPDHVVEKLKNKKLDIDMPHINAPDSWRKWALKIMVEFIDTYIDADINDSNVMNALAYFNRACFHYAHEEKEVPAVCTMGMEKIDNYDNNMSQARQIMRNIRGLIINTTDETEGEILPRLSYDLDLLYSFYPLLQRVWEYAQSDWMLPQATTNEWDYIRSQLPNNGWAVLRISHLLIEEEFKTSNNYNDEAKKHYRKIAKMLKIDEPLQPFHSSRALGLSEKKAFWKNIAHSTDENNFYMFKAVNESNDLPYYHILRSINDANLFETQNIDKTKAIIGNNVSHRELDNELTQVLNNQNAQEVKFLNEMWQNAENTEKIVAMSEEYFDRFPKSPEELSELANNQDYYIDIKSRFLRHESELKKPLFHHALKEASYLKLKDTPPIMDQICKYVPFHKKGLDIERYQDSPTYDHDAYENYLNKAPKTKKPYEVPREDYNDLFDATMIAQAALKQLHQKDTPKWAQKYADRILQSKEDVLAATWAIGSAILYFVSVPLTKGATLFLAPQIAATVAAVTSVGALALEIYSGGICELGVIIDAKNRTATRAELAEYGLMDKDTEIEVPFTYAWVILEIAFASQLIGQAMKGIKLFTRTMYATKEGVFKQLATNADKLAKYRQFAREISTSAAAKVLKFNRKQVRLFGKGWIKNGLNALRDEFFTGVSKTFTPDQANQQLAAVMTRYFNNSPDQLANFFGHFTTSKHQKVQNQLQRLIRKGKQGSEAFEKLSALDKAYITGRRIMTEARNLHSTDGIEGYILKNIDDICKSAMQLGWSNWVPGIEMPYHVLITGMPAGNQRLPGLNGLVNTLPTLATANDRILIQRMISARDILISDHNIKIAANTLGITVDDLTKFQLKRGFDKKLAETIRTQANTNPAFASKLNALIDNLDNEQAEAVIRYFKRKHKGTSISRMTPHDFKALLKSGNAQAIAAFNKTPADLLYGLKISQDTATEVINQLSRNDLTLNEFELLVNALKLRSISLNPRKFFPELKYTI